MADTPVGRHRGAGPERHARVDRQRLLDIVGVDEGREAAAVERTGLVAEDPCRRGGLVGDRGVGTGDQDDVRGVLHEGLEAGFAATGVERLSEGFAVEGEVDLSGEGFDRVGQLDGRTRALRTPMRPFSWSFATSGQMNSRSSEVLSSGTRRPAPGPGSSSSCRGEGARARPG